MTVFGCGIASFALLRSGIWQFYLTCFVFGVVGNGAAHLAYARSISTWFERRLGTALAFVMVGAGLGAMILPVIAQSVVTRSGWRASYLTLGIARSVAWASAELALHSRSWYDEEIFECRRSCALGTHLAARSEHLCILDHRRGPVCEFDQHERSDHASFGAVDRPRDHSRRCRLVRIASRWYQHTWAEL